MRQTLRLFLRLVFPTENLNYFRERGNGRPVSEPEKERSSWLQGRPTVTVTVRVMMMSYCVGLEPTLSDHLIRLNDLIRMEGVVDVTLGRLVGWDVHAGE